uniref:Uncharacterized protein n=1 Tax=Accipiter nisus TaxID=211598 RepID=A0A8B9NLF1_9AVES
TPSPKQTKWRITNLCNNKLISSSFHSSVTFACLLAFRSQSVVEAGTLKHEDQGESENTQPLLALD